MTSEDDPQFITIVSATAAGLLIGDETINWIEPWSAVDQVIVGRFPHGETTALTAVFGITSIDGERTVLITDFSPNWLEVMRVLHTELPCYASFEVWSEDVSPGMYFPIFKRRPLS